jgi:hypothetical protein
MRVECWKEYEEYAKQHQTAPIIATVKDLPEGNKSIQPDPNGCPAMAATRENKRSYYNFRNFITDSHPYNDGNSNLWYEGNGGGLQPSELASFSSEYFISKDVSTTEDWDLFDLYRLVYFNHTAVVDIGIINGNPAIADNTSDVNYAHFARVVSVNMTEGTITLADTIHGGTWPAISWGDYTNAASNPEGRGNSSIAEIVNRWLMIIK